jgi:tetratricopeptide (TPR) repeat protein
MRDRSGIAVLFFCLAMAHSGFSAAATGDAEANQLIARASGLRADGQLDLAIDALTAASHLAQSDATRGRAEGELGATLFEEHRYEDAETHLRVAYGALAGDARAAVAIDLGNLATVRHDPAGARRFYEEGAQSREPKVWFSAQLDLVRLSPAPARLALLERLAPQLGRLPDDHDRAF